MNSKLSMFQKWEYGGMYPLHGNGMELPAALRKKTHGIEHYESRSIVSLIARITN